MDGKTSLRLEITSACNLNCKYCHNKDAISNNDLSFDEIIKIINLLYKKNKINKLLLTGGEPMLNVNVYNIIKYAKKHNIKVDMVTNGTLLNQRNIIELSKAGLNRIRISIDNIDIDEDSRGYIEKNKLISLINYILSNTDIEVCIHTVVTPENVTKLYDIYNFVKKCGAKRWRVFDLGFEGGVLQNRINISSQYYEKYIAISKKIVLDNLNDNTVDIEINGIFRSEFKKLKNIEKKHVLFKDEHCCSYINHQMTIRSSGYTTFCQYFHNPIYNFKEYNFDYDKIVNNIIPAKENNIMLSDLKNCINCMYINTCKGGCRARAQRLTGSIEESDPVACYLHYLVHHEIMSICPDYIKNFYFNLLNEKNDPKFTNVDLEYFLNKFYENRIKS